MTPTRSGWLGPFTLVLLSIVAAAAMVGIGISFSSSFSASQVAANASALHWTNATLGSAGIARASVAQAVFFAFDERVGVSSSEAKNAALAEALDNLDKVERLASAPDVPNEASVEEVRELVALGRSILAESESGDPVAAEHDRLTEFEPLFRRVDQRLAARQTVLAATIADSQAAGGRIARITQLAITFIIPAMTMLVFWWVLRRRLRMRELELGMRLEAERSLREAKDEFISGLSHELRTPLTTILGFSDVLAEDARLPGDVAEMLGYIHVHSSDLSRMVNDLITAARIDEGSLSSKSDVFWLADLVESIVHPYLKAGESIEVRVPPIQVYADRVHVRQIVHNLVANAVRHGGNEIAIGARVSGSRAHLVVADSGPGLADQKAESAFQRYVHQGREALVAGSVGLGLAVSRELAMRMSGSLDYSRVNGWTVFTLTLPSFATQSPIVEPESVAVVG